MSYVLVCFLPSGGSAGPVRSTLGKGVDRRLFSRRRAAFFFLRGLLNVFPESCVGTRMHFGVLSPVPALTYQPRALSLAGGGLG